MSITTNRFFGRLPKPVPLLPSAISAVYAANFIVKGLCKFSLYVRTQIAAIAWGRPPTPMVAFQASRSA